MTRTNDAIRRCQIESTAEQVYTTVAALIDDIGVDGVITDRPDLMQRVLAPDTSMQATLETC